MPLGGKVFPKIISPDYAIFEQNSKTLSAFGVIARLVLFSFYFTLNFRNICHHQRTEGSLLKLFVQNRLACKLQS